MQTFVIGAGASAPSGAPTMATFLNEAFSGWLFTPPDRSDFEADLTIVAGVIDSQYGTNLLAARRDGNLSGKAQIALGKINIEDLLASTRDKGTSDQRRALERVIFKTLEQAIRDNGNRSEYYRRLVEEIVRADKKTCLISFNYDLLLDRALTEGTRKVSTWSYAVPFQGGTEDSYSHSDNPTVFLLKLHGSLNWGQCKTCHHLKLWYYTEYDYVNSTRWPCRNCSSSAGFEPVLVAPGALVNRCAKRSQAATSQACSMTRTPFTNVAPW